MSSKTHETRGPIIPGSPVSDRDCGTDLRSTPSITDLSANPPPWVLGSVDYVSTEAVIGSISTWVAEMTASKRSRPPNNLLARFRHSRRVGNGLGRRLFKIPEVAAALSVSRSKVYELIADGRLPSLKIDGSTLIEGRAIDAFIGECRDQSRDQGAVQ